MADIRHQPGGSKKMNATYKTKRATLTGNSLCQFMKKTSTLAVLYEVSVCDNKRRIKSRR